MPLQADRAFAELAAGARVVTRRAVIGPVDHWYTVHPRSDMVPFGEHGHGEPLVVLSRLEARRDAAINGPGAVIHGCVLGLPLVDQLVRAGVEFFDRVFLRWLRREAVMDLRFVTILVFVGPTTEENAAVETVAVAQAIDLQD